MFSASKRSRIWGTAAADSSLLTVIRTNSDPARASALTCATVPSMSAVSVLVMDCTTIGALPPIVTAPTFTPRDVLRGVIRELYQGCSFRHSHHHRPRDFVVPGLIIVVECDPNKPKAGDCQRQKTAERADDRRLPVDLSPIQPDDAQIEHDTADGRTPYLPHHRAVGAQQHQFKVRVMEQAHDKADQDYIEQQRRHANPESRAGQCRGDRLRRVSRRCRAVRIGRAGGTG